jgi:hypothetical protein
MEFSEGTRELDALEAELDMMLGSTELVGTLISLVVRYTAPERNEVTRGHHGGTTARRR